MRGCRCPPLLSLSITFSHFHTHTPTHTHTHSKEHSNDLNRYLHFVGTTGSLSIVLSDLRLIPAVLFALVVGLCVFEVTYWVSVCVCVCV